MNANVQQLRRIRRCHRFITRRRPRVPLEMIARIWIERYAEQWRENHRAA
jgi:hypothetical protein